MMPSNRLPEMILPLFLICAVSSAQNPADRHIATLSVTANNARDALKYLADESRVAIGFEPASIVLSAGKPIRISFQNGTVKDALDALVSAEPDYTWKVEDGVIDVLPRRRVDSLLDVVVSKFELTRPDAHGSKQVYKYNIVAQLIETPEVKQWSVRTGVQPRHMFAGSILIGGSSETPGPSAGSSERGMETRVLTNVSVRTLLNEIMKVSGSHYWEYSRYGPNDRYFQFSM